METLNFVPWTPTTTPSQSNPVPPQTTGAIVGGEVQGKTKTSVLEELQQTNAEIEQFLAPFRDPNIGFFILKKKTFEKSTQSPTTHLL